MAVIVVGATIYIAMLLINGLQGTACKANDAKFAEEIMTTLDEYSMKGNKDVAAITPSCDTEELCFVDAKTIKNPTGFSDSAHSTITVSVTNRISANMFQLSKGKPAQAVGYDARIELDAAHQTTPLCITKTNGKFMFATEGQGRTILLKAAP